MAEIQTETRNFELSGFQSTPLQKILDTVFSRHNRKTDYCLELACSSYSMQKTLDWLLAARTMLVKSTSKNDFVNSIEKFSFECTQNAVLQNLTQAMSVEDAKKLYNDFRDKNLGAMHSKDERLLDKVCQSIFLLDRLLDAGLEPKDDLSRPFKKEIKELVG